MSKFDLNKVGMKELLSIDGIGSDKAEKILAYRENNGGYIKDMDVLLNVKGIGEKYLNTIREYIEIGQIMTITFDPADYGLEEVHEVHLVGEMNEWNPADKSYSLKKNDDGKWVGDFPLEKGLEYKYMYDSDNWESKKYLGDRGENIIV